VAAVLILIPILFFGIELIGAGCLLGAALVGRVGFRRPWVVEAQASDPLTSGRVLEARIRLAEVARGRPWSHTSTPRGARWRAPAFAPHQLRHAHAVEMARGRAAVRHPAPARARAPRRDQHIPARNDTVEIVDTIDARRRPMIPASAGLRL
jgi:hypothetical protein